MIGKRDGHIVIITGIVRPGPFGLKTPEVRQLALLDHRLEIHRAQPVDADFNEILAGRCERGLRKSNPANIRLATKTSPGNGRDGVEPLVLS